jgi:NADH-quinone oxidoreductase subunit G
LPIAPFTETAGSFVNMEGKLQSFNGVVRPLGETRPGWKVLRVLGNLLGLAGFEYTSVEEVRGELTAASDIAGNLNNQLASVSANVVPADGGLTRVADVPMFHVDAITRRAESLQATRHAAAPEASAHPATLAEAGIADGDSVVAKQGSAEVRVIARADAGLPQGVVRLAAAHPATVALGGLFDPIEIKRG